MAVPKYNEFMLPLLKLCGDKKEYFLRDVVDLLADEFHLTDEDKNELLPSGARTALYDRVTWAKTYMTKARLLEKTGRASFRITERGIEVLKNPPLAIDVGFLKKFDEFLEFQKVSSEPIAMDGGLLEIQKNITPEETFEYGYATIMENLSSEVLDRLKTVSPTKFERVVVELLVKMGYGGTLKEAAGQVVGKSGDEGIDGIIKEDRLGLDFIYIQAKRWEYPVSRPEIQKFAGALLGKKSRKGVFITTARFTREAEDYARNIDASIILIDGGRLAQLMIENNIGTAITNVFEIKKIDNDYYDD